VNRVPLKAKRAWDTIHPILRIQQIRTGTLTLVLWYKILFYQQPAEIHSDLATNEAFISDQKNINKTVLFVFLGILHLNNSNIFKVKRVS
jgi:hypothetical protein